MGKKKQGKEGVVTPAAKHATPVPSDTCAVADKGVAASGSPPAAPLAAVAEDPAAAVSAGGAGGVAAPSQPQPRSRWRRLFPDLAKVALAVAVIGVASLIWYQPPLVVARFPYVSYFFMDQNLTDAVLFRPLAMPTRYYIRLPKKLAGRYEWFAVDRRREVVALAEAPARRFLGRHAIQRSDPLGLDLEFRKLDNSEWQVHFFADAIVFSNAVLTVRLDTRN